MEKLAQKEEHPTMDNEEDLAKVEAATSNDAFEENPMMNDVVLERMFSLSSPGDLNKFRLVCKHWLQLVLPLWLKNGFAISIKSEAESDDDNFLKFLEQVHLNPSSTAGIKQYRKFHLESSDTVYLGQCFEVFWKEVGPHLTHLTLSNFKISDAVTIKSILFCKHTPNLECLVVELYSIELEERLEPRLLQYGVPREHKKLYTLKVDVKELETRHFPIDWKILLNIYPNLKDFAVGRNLSCMTSVANDLLEAIKEIRSEDKRKLALKSFTWFFNQCFGCKLYTLTPASIPPALQQIQLQNLESFSYCFSDEVSAEEAHDLLSIYAKTLKKLQIYRADYFTRSPFPEMAQLRSMEMTGFPVKDLTFLKMLPNLRSLSLYDDYRSRIESPETLLSATIIMEPELKGIGGFPNLSEFFCTYDIFWTTADFTRLVELMPNLVRLGMNLDNSNFPLVCRYLPQLEHLRVYGNSLGDDGILGEIKKENDDAHNMTIYSQPNIARLSNLKSFIMEGAILSGTSGGGSEPRGSNISQNSVIHGFLKLPRLENLVVGVEVLDTEIKEFLLKTIPFAKVIVSPHFCPVGCMPALSLNSWSFF